MGDKFKHFVEWGTDCIYVPVGAKCDICGKEGIAPGIGIFAQLLGEPDQLQIGSSGQAFPNSQAGGAGAAVNKYLSHGLPSLLHI